MQVIRTISDARAARAGLGTICLVPTMGALHRGHVSLMEAARRAAPRVAVSIFVNPTQFGPREDYSKYPRPVEKDLAICREAGVDLVFNPAAEEMYPADSPEISIDLPAFTTTLEGAKRPGHFKGVCHVVAKLFNILTPDFACFGAKDYQQLRVIQSMTTALNFPTEVIACPTMRDADGLALSSRNAYLSADERKRALCIHKALESAREQVKSGYRSTARLITTMQKMLLEQHLLVDYVAAVDAVSFKPVAEVNAPTLLAIAAHVGSTRLIDNTVVRPE